MTEATTKFSDPVVTGVEIIDAPGSPLIRVSALVASVRRKSQQILLSGLVGLLLALAFFVVRGPQYSARTTLLLRRVSINQQDPTKAMLTDVELAASRTVAARAISQLQLDVAVTTFLAGYQVTSVTDDIMQITATAATAASAVQRADAVADAFLSFRAQGMDQETQVQVGAIQHEINGLNAQLRPVNDQINAATVDAAKASQTAVTNALGDLLARRSQLSGQIATDEQRIGDLSADSTASVQNSRVLDSGSLDHRSAVKALILDLAVGLVGGLALSAGSVLLVTLVSDKVSRRDEVAIALDAPVLASVGARPRTLLRRHPRRPQDPAHPDPETKKAARYLRDILPIVATPTPALAVVSVDSDERAGLAVASLVLGLLGEGNDVLLVDLSAKADLASLFGVAPNAVSMVQPGGTTSKLWVSSRTLELGGTLGDWLRLHNLRDETDVVIVLATLDPAVGAGHLAELATTSAAVVTAARSSAASLRAVGQMVRAAGMILDSVVLLDADPKDHSVGLISASPRAQRAWTGGRV